MALIDPLTNYGLKKQVSDTNKHQHFFSQISEFIQVFFGNILTKFGFEFRCKTFISISTFSIPRLHFDALKKT